MKVLFNYIKEYVKETDTIVFFLALTFLSIAIFINYYFGLNRMINSLPESFQFVSWLAVFLTSFSFVYVLRALFFQQNFFRITEFVALLFLAPVIFAWKMSANVMFFFSSDIKENAYWNLIIYWPFKLLVVTTVLFFIWRFFDRDKPFYGMNTKGFKAAPYFIMLAFMVPLIAAASTQPDFLAMYPKLKNIHGLAHTNTGLYSLFYELSYGSDFFSIELFFRGFLVLAFAKWAGRDAILPMAVFYCTIHFGKPIGECISSFFGGILLGIVTYNTHSIFGGLIVHLGIAWLMEIGGYLGSSI